MRHKTDSSDINLSCVKDDLKSLHIDFESNKFRMGRMVLAPFSCNQQKQKNAHLNTAEKIDFFRKITVQHKI